MNDKIKELIRLSDENPELEIITMVSYEVCGGDDYQYWRGEIQSIGIDYQWDCRDREMFYIGKELIKNEIELMICDLSEF